MIPLRPVSCWKMEKITQTTTALGTLELSLTLDAALPIKSA